MWKFNKNKNQHEWAFNRKMRVEVCNKVLQHSDREDKASFVSNQWSLQSGNERRNMTIRWVFLRGEVK